MKTKKVPGQNYQGVIGFRIHLGWRNALKTLFGAPVMLGLRLITPIPIPGIQTQADILVGGKAALKGARLDIVDIPPGVPDAPSA